MDMGTPLTREECIAILKRRQEELGRLPKRSDCTEEEVVKIKAYFGPWPRALEKAGLKQPGKPDRKQRTVEKRIRTKRRILAAKKEKKKAENAISSKE